MMNYIVIYLHIIFLQTESYDIRRHRIVNGFEKNNYLKFLTKFYLSN